ncbi:unnamed protein product [Amaranthus hypochondriacus]
MDGKAIVASIIVGILGLYSTVVALIFEFMPPRTQGRHLYKFRCTNELCVVYECLYLRSPAFYMGAAAVASLIIALILISISADCGCGTANRSSSGTRALAILAFVFCWLKCLAAIILFLLAGVAHYGLDISKVAKGSSLSDALLWTYYKRCYRVKKGVYGAAAALSFIGIALGIISYIALVADRKRVRPPRRGNTTVPTPN